MRSITQQVARSKSRTGCTTMMIRASRCGKLESGLAPALSACPRILPLADSCASTAGERAMAENAFRAERCGMATPSQLVGPARITMASEDPDSAGAMRLVFERLPDTLADLDDYPS